MGGFADFMGTSQAIGGGGAKIAFGNGSAPNALNIPSTNRLAPMKNGGLGGFLYNNFLAAPANSIGNLTAEGAAGAGQALTGDKDILLHKNPATDGMSAAYAQSSPVAQAMSNEKAAGGSVGQQLEVGAGGLASDVTNVGGLLLGPGEMAGKTGLGLIGSGAKIGGELGLVGGASGAAAQGGSAGQVAESAGLGAAEGAGIGAAGGTLGATLGKLSGRTADQAGAGADAASGNQEIKGFASKQAAKGGVRVADAQKAQAAIDFSGDADNAARKIISPDKQGNPVGIDSVQGFLRGLDMDQDVEGMQHLSNISNRTLRPDLEAMTNGINVDGSHANQVGTNAVVSRVGKEPTEGTATGSHADVAQRAINDATDKLGPQSTVKEMLDARQKLTSAKAVSDIATKTGDLRGAGVSQAYQDTIDHLDRQMNGSAVNKAVENYTVSPEAEANIRQIVNGELGRGLTESRPTYKNGVQVGMSRVDDPEVAAQKAATADKVAQHYIDAENNAKSYQDLISETQIPTLAGHLAKLGRDTFESAPAKVDKRTGSPQIPSWQLAQIPHNPAYGISALAKLAENTHPIQGIARILNPDAFKIAQARELAPNAATQEKLDMPGVGGGSIPAEGPTPTPSVADQVASGNHTNGPLLSRQSPASSMEGRRGEAMHPASPMSNEAATQPAQTAPETPQASSVQQPTGVPVQGDTVQTPTAPAVAPQEAQPIGIRANANPSPGPEVNGISGPIPNSGATMGARPGAEQPVPVSVPAPAQAVPTRPMQTTNVPVQAEGTGQASGELPMAPPSALENTLNAVTGGAHAIASKVQPAEEAIENAAGKVPGAVANRIQNSSIGRAVSAGSKPGANKLIGALTGMGAATTGQSAQAQLARKGGGSVTAATSPEIPTNFTLASGSSASGAANSNSVYPQANELADIEADPTHASTYETLYKDLNPTPTAAQSTGAQSIIDASGYINTIEQELNSFGGVSLAGGLAASIPILGKYIEPQISAYNATKNDAAIALAKALTGKSASAAQVKITAESLPDITDSPEEAASKLDNIRLELAQKAPGYGLVASQ